MYKLILAFCLLISFLSKGQEVHFTLSGKFKEVTRSTMLYLNGDSIKLPSNKVFKYQGKLKNPGMLLLRTNNSYNTEIWINGRSSEVELEEYEKPGRKKTGRNYLKIHLLNGSKETLAFGQLMDTFDQIASKHPTRNYLGADSLMLQFYTHEENFVRKNTGSFLSPYLVKTYPFNLEGKKELFAMIRDNSSKDDLEVIKTQIERGELVKKGATIANFTQPTPEGKIVELYSLNNRFILIQFWASWCVPCRVENPNLLALYTLYHPKGLEIVSISLDDNHSDWTQAIAKDSLSWIQGSDLLGWKNELAQRYKLDHVPFNILLDSSYTIIASDLWPNQIKEILEQLN